VYIPTCFGGSCHHYHLGMVTAYAKTPPL